MKKILALFLGVSSLLTGCSPPFRIENKVEIPVIPETIQTSHTVETNQKESDIVLPIAGYGERLTFKTFGQFVEDRFHGYHVGDDIEYNDKKEEIPVMAIADGEIVVMKKASGYGGVILIKHTVKDKIIHALYGHLDLSSANLKTGDAVTKGQFLANLGDDKSEETDRERKHLHFALYEGSGIRLQGYESSPEKVTSWINPYDFFVTNGIEMTKITDIEIHH